MAISTKDTICARSFKYLSIVERSIIYVPKNELDSLRAIARRIGRPVSIISREMIRGRTMKCRTNWTSYEAYSPETGQAVYEKNRAHSRSTGNFYQVETFSAFIEQKMINDRWAPDSVVGFCRLQPE